MSGQKPREIAVRILGRRSSGDYVEDLFERAIATAGLSPADRRLCQELVYGIVRWQATLDWLIARKTQGRTQKAALRDLLRLGLYQIFWLERIPDHAAVNETVELARKNGLGPQAGFVNAVLRGYLREVDATRGLLADLKARQPALGWSHPDWLVDRWQHRWGADPTNRLLAWNNSPPATFARVNTLKTDAEHLLPQWRDENVEYDFVRKDWLEENLIFELKAHPSLTRLPSFQQGLFYIQDPSTLLAVRELAPAPGDTALDLCAAPGGKLTCLAQMMRNEGRLVAQDVGADRLKLVSENCARLGVTCAQMVPAATVGAASLAPRSFNKILVDAPCSNTGVMRRRVDLRWRIRPEEILRLRTAQLALLENAAALLKPGGALVYSTCSLEPEENEQVIQEFLAAHPDCLLTRERMLRPFVEGTDGAYVARVEKSNA